jgi:hypothetical protein
MLLLTTMALLAVTTISASTIPACGLTDWNNYLDKMKFFGDAINFAQNSSVIKHLEAKLNHLSLDTVPASTDEVHVFWKKYLFTTSFVSANVSGLNTITIYPIEVPTPTSIKFGVIVPDLALKNLKTIVNVRYPNRESHNISLTFGMELVGATFSSVSDIKVMKCGGKWLNMAACKISSGFQFIKSLVTMNPSAYLLHRVSSASVLQVDIAFRDFKVEGGILDGSAKGVEAWLIEHAIKSAQGNNTRFTFMSFMLIHYYY